MPQNVLDPYAQPGIGGDSTLTDVQPEGFELHINPDGTADAIPPDEIGHISQTEHFANLAEFLDETRLATIANDLLEAIEQDKESRQERDRQYEEGLNRTGMGNNTVGGADFPGASRANHPLLLESAIDFGARVMNELLPPEGPCKAVIVGDETDQKQERAKRVARYMNWQLTEQMTSAYHEFEVGLTQCPLGGAFYTKTYTENDVPAVSFIPIDSVYRPWNDGDFYTQPRITHAQNVDRWTYRENVRNGLWRDIGNADPGSDIPEESQAEQANDRIVGRSQPTENVDGIREVYETSCILSLENDEAETEPYLVTMDVQRRKILSIYRNWKEGDQAKKRLVFLIEWPFWPWRGGYPVGLTHMIGSLTGAATGSLRALLDSAMLNTTQTGVRLKGGATSGGQNISPRVTEITEIQGSLAQDDIRKTFMPIKFNEPSPTLFQLLGFLVDSGRGVVRTTFDEYDKFSGQTPVGTAQMFIEQGLKSFGAVHGRMHRSMRLFLKGLYEINSATLTDQTIIDQQGELTVSARDFQGPMQIIPVSDPRIFSDIQRKAMAQTIVQRAMALPMIYDLRKSETHFLKQMGVADPDQYFQPQPEPVRQNSVAENVTASNGGVIKAFPGQDHEAHLTVHIAFLKSPVFGQNPALALKYIPTMIGHLGEHLALWYSDAMLEAATTALRSKTGNPMLTLESFMMEGTEVPLDRLMAELDDEVLGLAMEELGEVPEVIEEAHQLLKSFAPPQPMDPSVVAAEDVQRQRDADQGNLKLKLVDLAAKRQELEQKAQREDRKMQADIALKAQDQALRREEAARRDQIAVTGIQQTAQTAAEQTAAKLEMNEEDNATAIEITDLKNKSAEETTRIAAKAAEKRAAATAKGRTGRGNLKTGTGQNPGPRN